MSIELRHITKRFGGFSALQDVTLSIPTGELVALLGPSGCGKTTLLRIIAGLETPDRGVVEFDGVDIADRNLRERRVGFVFQHYALFRHMSVVDNVAFGLVVRPRKSRPPAAEIRERVMRLLCLVQLEHLANRRPSELSGGQRQRVALARALAVEPSVLLLDEPFGALDARVRAELRRWLRRLHDEIHVTSVFVTHDQEEALEVADYVVVMNEGRVEQIGRPDEVYHVPATPFVFRFLGNVNLFHGRVEGKTVDIAGMRVELPEGADPSLATADIYVRPHLLDLANAPGESGGFAAVVKHVNPAGPLVKVELLSGWGELVHVEVSEERYRSLAITPGAPIYVVPKKRRITLW